MYADVASSLMGLISEFWPYLLVALVALALWGLAKGTAQASGAYYGWAGVGLLLLVLGGFMWYYGVGGSVDGLALSEILVIAGVLILIGAIVV